MNQDKGNNSKQSLHEVRKNLQKQILKISYKDKNIQQQYNILKLPGLSDRKHTTKSEFLMQFQDNSLLQQQYNFYNDCKQINKTSAEVTYDDDISYQLQQQDRPILYQDLGNNQENQYYSPKISQSMYSQIKLKTQQNKSYTGLNSPKNKPKQIKAIEQTNFPTHINQPSYINQLKYPLICSPNQEKKITFQKNQKFYEYIDSLNNQRSKVFQKVEGINYQKQQEMTSMQKIRANQKYDVYKYHNPSNLPVSIKDSNLKMMQVFSQINSSKFTNNDKKLIQKLTLEEQTNKVGLKKNLSEILNRQYSKELKSNSINSKKHLPLLKENTTLEIQKMIENHDLNFKKYPQQEKYQPLKKQKIKQQNIQLLELEGWDNQFDEEDFNQFEYDQIGNQ